MFESQMFVIGKVKSDSLNLKQPINPEMSKNLVLSNELIKVELPP